MSGKKKKKKKPGTGVPKIRKIYQRDGGRCFWCGKPLSFEDKTLMPTKDHVMPRSKGGTNALFNLVCCCGPCNTEKSNWLINPHTKQPISPSVLWVFLKEVRRCGA